MYVNEEKKNNPRLRLMANKSLKHLLIRVVSCDQRHSILAILPELLSNTVYLELRIANVLFLF